MPALWLLFLPAIAYQVLSIAAALQHLFRRLRSRQAGQNPYEPPISVLKPLRGLDPNTFEAFASQASQDYPTFELLFGIADAGDPAAQAVERLQKDFPAEEIRLFAGAEAVANGKAGVLANLSRHAQHSIWFVNDSDIRVEREYLREVVRPLADESVAVVTCLYRPRAHTLPAFWEALGIATDFMPSTLVAQLIGVREFGLGSTLAFRADDLRRAGGFEAIGDYLADDYHLAKRLTRGGKRAVVSTYTVETSLGDQSWTGCWQHQLRWARTIRFSKGGGYAGLPFAHAGIWIVIALALGVKFAALSLLALRLASALLGGALVLESWAMAGVFWLAPLWDLYSFAVWLASYAGRQVRWRDRTMNIGPEGRIEKTRCR